MTLSSLLSNRSALRSRLRILTVLVLLVTSAPLWGVDRPLPNQFFGSFLPHALLDVASVLRPVIGFASNPAAPIDLALGPVMVSGNMTPGALPASLRLSGADDGYAFSGSDL